MPKGTSKPVTEATRLKDGFDGLLEATLTHRLAWEANHYHRPSDELTPDWDFSGMVEDAALGLACVLAIAQEPTLPSWLPGDEFAPARAKALAGASKP
jgi:hypothetical protein